MPSLEPKYCEHCGVSFLREVGSKERFCSKDRKLGQIYATEDVAVRRERLADDLLTAIALEGIGSARAIEISDALRTLDAADRVNVR